ncbi:hypothetical protein [Enterococcus sp. LJL128]
MVDGTEAIKYTGEACEHCNRVRVELLTDGDLVCEKCLWSQKSHEYRFDLDD